MFRLTKTTGEPSVLRIFFNEQHFKVREGEMQNGQLFRARSLGNQVSSSTLSIIIGLLRREALTLARRSLPGLK